MKQVRRTKKKTIFVMQMRNWLYMKVVLRLYTILQSDPLPAKKIIISINSNIGGNCRAA